MWRPPAPRMESGWILILRLSAVHGTQDPDTNCELAHTLGRNNGQENAIVTEPFTLAIRGRSEGSTVEVRNDGTANALLTPNGGRAGMGVGAIGWGMQVRRLTPIECERLQGFPDNHTLIGWRGKNADECPDGPRYKAIGNSMAVPVMRWIGERIAAALPAEKTNGDYGGSKTPLDQRDLWRTPPALFTSLDAEFCFQLDAAAAPHNALCRKFITAEQNTLETPWADYLSIPGYVWLNPPYSEIMPFVKKAPQRAPIRSARSCWFRQTHRLAGSRRLSRPPARFASSLPGGWRLSTRSPVSR